MVRSMRWRLLAWYATVLVVVIAGFALLMYFQSSRARMQQIDEQLIGAVQYFDAILMRFPAPEIDPPEGRRRARPSSVLPPGAWDRLELTDEQKKEIEALDADVRNRLDTILTVDLELPPSLAPREGDRPEDDAHFVVWRSDGTVLKAAPQSYASAWRTMPPLPATASDQPLRLQSPLSREFLKRGPHGMLILAGKPIGRELAELSSLGWRLAGTGSLALAIGLAGGWWIARGFVQPLARISETAGALSATNLSGRIDPSRLDDELVGLAEVLNETFSRLEAAFSRQTRFTADASHELRTPLAILHSQIELTLKRPRTADEYREALETCRRASERMRSLLDGLLTLARADAGSLALAFLPVELNRLVEEAVAQYRDDAQREGVTLSMTLAPEPVVVNGDPAFLARVLANLLANAFRHTPAGGKVQVSLSIDSNRAMLAVADTGSGIPLEDQSRIFERFFRVDKARSRASGGSGLGLAICKSVVESHAGTISFASDPGHGTTFTVTLPLTAAGETPDRDTVTEAAATA